MSPPRDASSNFLWPPTIYGSAALLALAAGWWSLREVLRRPVVQTLRSAAE